VFLVTHSIMEAVYLGDRVWIFTRAPGRIGHEFRDIPTTPPGISTLEFQRSQEFQAAVERVAEEFRRVDTRNEAAQKADAGGSTGAK